MVSLRYRTPYIIRPDAALILPAAFVPAAPSVTFALVWTEGLAHCLALGWSCNVCMAGAATECYVLPASMLVVRRLLGIKGTWHCGRHLELFPLQRCRQRCSACDPHRVFSASALEWNTRANVIEHVRRTRRTRRTRTATKRTRTRTRRRRRRSQRRKKPNTKQRCALESEFERNAHCCNGQIGIRSGEHHRLALVVSACFHHDGFRRRQGSRGGNRGNQGLERARFFTAVAIASAWRYVADERSGRCEMRDTLLV